MSGGFWCHLYLTAFLEELWCNPVLNHSEDRCTLKTKRKGRRSIHTALTVITIHLKGNMGML